MLLIMTDLVFTRMKTNAATATHSRTEKLVT